MYTDVKAEISQRMMLRITVESLEHRNPNIVLALIQNPIDNRTYGSVVHIDYFGNSFSLSARSVLSSSKGTNLRELEQTLKKNSVDLLACDEATARQIVPQGSLANKCSYCMLSNGLEAYVSYQEPRYKPELKPLFISPN